MQIVVLRLGALGDTLLAAPALLALRRAYPGARIGMVGQGAVGQLLKYCGAVDEAEDTASALGEWLLGGAPSVFQTAQQSALARPALAIVWRRWGGAEVAARWGALGARRTLCASSHPPDGLRQHVAEHLLATLEPLGIVRSDVAVALRVPPTDLALGRRMLADLGLREPVFVLHPGSGGAPKRWPPLRFAALGRALQEHGDVLVVGGAADDEAVRAVLAAGRAWRVLANPPLVDLAKVLAVATAYIGNDSGPSHLAALLGCPTVALYGPTDPAVWGVRGPRARAVLAHGVTVAKWTPVPMDAIDVADVLDALRSLGVLA